MPAEHTDGRAREHPFPAFAGHLLLAKEVQKLSPARDLLEFALIASQPRHDLAIDAFDRPAWIRDVAEEQVQLICCPFQVIGILGISVRHWRVGVRSSVFATRKQVADLTKRFRPQAEILPDIFLLRWEHRSTYVDLGEVSLFHVEEDDGNLFLVR